MAFVKRTCGVGYRHRHKVVEKKKQEYFYNTISPSNAFLQELDLRGDIPTDIQMPAWQEKGVGKNGNIYQRTKRCGAHGVRNTDLKKSVCFSVSCPSLSTDRVRVRWSRKGAS
ncbi:MAG: hypothetical protein HZC01_02035 [Candidatus Kerfeldbacteria bacterium]|nr:hypothetical protein [Candidatus Kerfeldbacteria bacterium]